MDGAHVKDMPDAALDAAFSRQWNDARSRLRAIALNLTNGNRDDAQDLLADVALRLLVAWRKQGGQIDNFGGWAAISLRNQWIETLRRRKRGATLTTDLTECQMMSVGVFNAPERCSQTARAEAERTQALRRHIRTTPRIYREAFVLHCLRERPYAALSAHLGVTEPTLRKRVQIARAMIREKIREDQT